jgi:hypothetical protein
LLVTPGLVPPTKRTSQIQRHAVQPSVKLSRAAESFQLGVRLHERILQHLAGIVLRTQHTRKHVEQAILIALNQHAKGLAATRQRRLDQVRIGA